ncbi:unnamed protein product [Blepharisma stoltei]|uniref:Potassium channel domain-containing protein n=1 Tax=Blepharisma stoltei TaxID=1481888 RepID=A0AAU9IIC0_9CILI|nr:unnamed protein product [Blepharisma stoltei]
MAKIQFSRNFNLVHKKNEVIGEVQQSQILLNRWRIFRLASAIFSAVSVFPAGTDYEMRFSEARNAENCDLDTDHNSSPRFLVMILCLISIILLIPYRYYYIKWRKHIPSTYRELPCLAKISLSEYSKLKKKATWRDYLGGDTIFAFCVNIIFPYPGLNATFTLRQQILYQEVNICYFWAELFYAMMFFRWAFLIFVLFNYGSYQNPIAMRYCEKYDVPPSPYFSLKCYVNQNPMAMLFLFLLLPGTLIFASTMRIFERPMKRSAVDFDYPGNAIWNVIVTIFTIGYGDFFPATNLGRITIALSSFLGSVVLSFLFVTLTHIFTLTSSEEKALKEILLTNSAIATIKRAFTYTKSKFSTSEEKINAWDSVQTQTRSFNKIREELGIDADDNEAILSDLSERVLKVEANLEKFKCSITLLSHKFDSLNKR